MDLGLAGKHALITGASRGIGAAIARRLAGESCRLTIAARSAEGLAALADELAAAEAVAIDLAADGAPARLAEEAGPVDILINNAGAIPPGRLHEIDDAHWRAVWELKVFGYINLIRAVYPEMAETGGGAIVNIGGASGERPKANYICGATANAALRAFTRALGGDSMTDGIRVVALNPGPTGTEHLERLTRGAAAEKLGDAERWRKLFAPLPGGRATTVDEIADTAVFLASPRSSYTSGTVVTVDGGCCNRGSLM